MKKFFKKSQSVIFILVVISLLALPFNNLVVLAESSNAPTVVGDFYDDFAVNYLEEKAGFLVSVTLASSSAGDVLELYSDEGQICDIDVGCDESTFAGHQAITLNTEDTAKQYDFTLNHGQLTDGTSSLTYLIWHNEGTEIDPVWVDGAQSDILYLFIDTIGPDISISAPASGDVVNANRVIEFDPHASDLNVVNIECRINGNDWSTCESGVTTIGDIIGFVNLPDTATSGINAFTFYVRAEDEYGNTKISTTSEIIKDTTNPVGHANVTNGTVTEQIPTFDVTVTYNEIMDTGVDPVISFGPTTSFISTTSNGHWGTDDNANDVWMQSFRLVDVDEEQIGVVIKSTGAIDLVGNPESTSTIGYLNIDTKAPLAAISIDNYLIHRGDLLQTVTVDFGEEMFVDNDSQIGEFSDSQDWELLNFGWIDNNSSYVMNFRYYGVDGNGIDNGIDEDYYVVLDSVLTDIAGNDALFASSSLFRIDTKTPFGYSADIDQSLIDRSNQKSLSFTYVAVELGATYYYTVDDGNVKTPAISGNGLVATATSVVSGLDVSKLSDGTLTLTFNLITEAGYEGVAVSDTVLKKITSSSGYIPPSSVPVFIVPPVIIPLIIQEEVKGLNIEKGEVGGEGDLDLEKDLVLRSDKILGITFVSNSTSTPDKKIIKLFAGKNINKFSQDLITSFIRTGSEWVSNVGAGERMSVIETYWQVYGKFPVTKSEWFDVFNMTNGELPEAVSKVALDNARQSFVKIYKRKAVIANKKDQAALNLIAYGLRVRHRNMSYEKVALKKFQKIYKYNPSSMMDWNLVRAIAYSGVKL
ncbi:hypothetical protein L6270_04030 [Candidatus Parcubacteria bacterium]|nr:hypothetical protein [Patescibacteria group bacterium]MBU4309132.1 hypothetical protein [Patescibacteria group bacterium]MBU4432181.1 hypothetical protein [Patescibacteria group bacterium]MBU4577493.1 hypothetical protein [Patescibacteria group bacterium]MCG2697180.1 hypothetical protein [Candidatus Parcubacteria bacterium]